MPTLHIAADPVQWEYAPNGNNCMAPGVEIDRPIMKAPPNTKGGTFLKGQYRLYSDYSFKVRACVRVFGGVS